VTSETACFPEWTNKIVREIASRQGTFTE